MQRSGAAHLLWLVEPRENIGDPLPRDAKITRCGHLSVVVRDVSLALTCGALKVSPHNAHRHRVSFVISFARVPTFVEPHAEQAGRIGTSVDMKPSVSGKRVE